MARVSAPWLGHQPFAEDQDRRPTVIPQASFVVTSGGLSDDGWHGPCVCQIILSTPSVGFVCLMYLGPGEYFPSGNHPHDETYLHLQGTLHLVNPDSGQVLEIEPGDAAVIPAFQFHTGYNLGPEPTITLACVPKKPQTAEFEADPDRRHHHDHEDLQPFAGPVERPGVPSFLRELRAFPLRTAVPRADAWSDANTRLPRAAWAHFVHGPKISPAIVSVYYASPDLLAGTLRVGPGRIVRPLRFGGECLLFALKSPLIVNFSEGGESLWVALGDAAFIPEETEFQIQSISGMVTDAAVFIAPWMPPTSESQRPPKEIRP